ncbi:MAG: DUF2283 domain-containing protein, partial [Leptospiraceae bacterium]|nr:DUF2283 domain-containing protein [Leptospiraceae bacterium]
MIHDTKANTLTIWLDDPNLEYSCDETEEEIILMKDKNGKLIGMEILHYNPSNKTSLIVEA